MSPDSTRSSHLPGSPTDGQAFPRPLACKARRWSEDDRTRPVAHAYEAAFSRLPRLLFQELALAQVAIDRPLVHDVAPGQGLGVAALQDAVGGDRLRLGPLSDDGHPASEPVDLLLAYSMLRLQDDPAAFLAQVATCLADTGRACLTDFVGGADPDLHRFVLDRVDDADQRNYLADQFAAAPTTAEVTMWLATAGLENYRLAIGGLAGHPAGGIEAARLIARCPRVMPLLMQMSSNGLRSPRAADLVFHLTILGEKAE